ncbi:benzoate/H(+) symporter BenE family transporter [Leucobacter sp. CSA2]|uniref:Benzoate/H(+) symporter BenE family transporter n=1 Tax=Leucobacter edaphi TaxID=2796472 RepID=A0A934QD22_9MICO|nr:benzoate/H(+) symporter BenE family transporter [Leucobacter edaphi]MBK0421585.1 benzoate/H(+) symporter BenE family transporter [Leucobacter edaphi]
MNRPPSAPRPREIPWAPISAGTVAALVAFAATFAVLLSGLRAVGANPAQAASGLLAVTLAMGASALLLSWRFKMPLAAAWSTPGAALLITTGTVAGGWPAAVGAFLVTGALLVLTGLWPGLTRLVQRIPGPIAQGMLAGVLFPLVLGPIPALAEHPLVVAPILVVWLVMLILAPKWAVPLALVAGIAVIAIGLVTGGQRIPLEDLVPTVEFTMPTITLQALTGIALPLYLVTMASQNIPGVAVLAGFGFAAPWRASLVTTGGATMLAAPFGGHAANLAAISTALTAGPDAGPRERRWIAGVSMGVTYLVLGVLSSALTALVLAAPQGAIEAITGVAMISAFAAACAGAMSVEHERVPAAVTILVAASGVTAIGLGSAFWALAAGILVSWVLAIRRRIDGRRTAHS